MCGMPAGASAVTAAAAATTTWRKTLCFLERCKHVNFCENSDVHGEEEFLFAPYSVFTVLFVTVPSSPSDDDPVIVRLLAAVLAVDNIKEAEDLPLAPWY
jgi:hypothetical protein